MYKLILKDKLTTQEKLLDTCESYGEAASLLPQYEALYCDDGMYIEIVEEEL